MLTGITSWGIGCGDRAYPGLYANVYSELSWIRDHIRKDTKDFPRYELINMPTKPLTPPTRAPRPTRPRPTRPKPTRPKPTRPTQPGVYRPHRYQTYTDGQYRFKKILPHPPAHLGSCDNTPSSAAAFPWIAYLVFANAGECTGTIIGDKEVLTSTYPQLLK